MPSRGERRVRRDARAVRLDPRPLEGDGAPRDPHATGAGEGEAGRGRRRAGRRAQRDLARPARRVHVPAGRLPAQRAVDTRGHRHVGAREVPRQRGDVEPLGPQPEVGSRGGDERERALGDQPPAVAPRLERLEHQARALEPPAPVDRPGAEALQREGGRGGGERARDGAVLHLHRRVGPERAVEAGAGREGLDERPVERGPEGRGGRDRRDPLQHAVDVERGFPGHDPRPLEDQPTVVEGERALGRGRLHGQTAFGPAHPRVGDPQGDPSPAVALRHLRVEATQHEPGLARRVAQLEPAVLDLGPAEPLERAPRLGGEAGGRGPRHHRLARVAHHDPRPEEVDVGPRLGRPVEVDPLRLHGDAVEPEARRRDRGPALPQGEVEPSEPQLTPGRARAPRLEGGPGRRESRRRVQEREREGEEREGEERKPEEAAQEPAEPGASPPARGRRISLALLAFLLGHRSIVRGQVLNLEFPFRIQDSRSDPDPLAAPRATTAPRSRIHSGAAAGGWGVRRSTPQLH